MAAARARAVAEQPRDRRRRRTSCRRPRRRTPATAHAARGSENAREARPAGVEAGGEDAVAVPERGQRVAVAVRVEVAEGDRVVLRAAEPSVRRSRRPRRRGGTPCARPRRLSPLGAPRDHRDAGRGDRRARRAVAATGCRSRSRRPVQPPPALRSARGDLVAARARPAARPRAGAPSAPVATSKQPTSPQSSARRREVGDESRRGAPAAAPAPRAIGAEHVGSGGPMPSPWVGLAPHRRDAESGLAVTASPVTVTAGDGPAPSPGPPQPRRAGGRAAPGRSDDSLQTPVLTATALPSGATAKPSIGADGRQRLRRAPASRPARLGVRARHRRRPATTTVTLPSAARLERRRSPSQHARSRTSSARPLAAGERVAERSTVSPSPLRSATHTATNAPFGSDHGARRSRSTSWTSGVEVRSVVSHGPPRGPVDAPGPRRPARPIQTATELPSASVATSGPRRCGRRRRCGSAASHVRRRERLPRPDQQERGREQDGEQFPPEGHRPDYRGRAGGTQPRLRADRRVAYSRPPDGSDVRLIAVLLAAAALLPAAAQAAGPAATRVRARLADALRRRRLGRAGGRPRQRAPRSSPRAPTRRARRPRSNKLFTTSTALTLYGVDGHLTTRALGDVGVDPGGVLIGNLYLRGGGDPSFGSLQAAELADELVLDQRPARDHRARDRRRVGLRLAARRRRRRATAPPARSGR